MSGSGLGGRMTPEAYRWALWVLGVPADDEPADDGDADADDAE